MCKSDEEVGSYSIDIKPKLVLSNILSARPAVNSSKVADDTLEGFRSCVQKTGVQKVNLCNLSNVDYECGDTSTMLSHRPCQEQCTSQMNEVHQDMAGPMPKSPK